MVNEWLDALSQEMEKGEGRDAGRSKVLVLIDDWCGGALDAGEPMNA